MFRFYLGLLLQGQTRLAKLKSTYNLLIIEKCCLSSKPCQLSFTIAYILHLATMRPWSIFFRSLGPYSQRFLEFFLELNLSLRKILC